MYKIFAINLGSTSTKIAYYEDKKRIFTKEVVHSEEDLHFAKSLFDQHDFRRRDIERFMEENGIRAAEMDAIVSRGGLTRPIEGGVYLIEEDMLAELRSGEYGIHPCCLGSQIAWELAGEGKALPLIVDSPSTCEMEPLAFYSGLPGLNRMPQGQPLNTRAMAMDYCKSVGKKYKESNLLVLNLGGGITVAAHKQGRIVDTQDGVMGDGAFSNNRCNGVPVGALVDLCYSGKYTYEEMKELVCRKSGLMGYLGVMDVRLITEEIQNGNELFREVLDALCYQVSKDVGAYATVLKGRVDAIIITGNMAYSDYVVGHIKDRISFLGPVVVMPGHREMEALCSNAYRALIHKVPVKHFRDGIVDIRKKIRYEHKE